MPKYRSPTTGAATVLPADLTWELGQVLLRVHRTEQRRQIEDLVIGAGRWPHDTTRIDVETQRFLVGPPFGVPGRPEQGRDEVPAVEHPQDGLGRVLPHRRGRTGKPRRRPSDMRAVSATETDGGSG